jgi:hypothetical protein
LKLFTGCTDENERLVECMGWMASAVQAVLAATAAFAAFAVVSNRHSIFKAIPNE